MELERRKTQRRTISPPEPPQPEKKTSGGLTASDVRIIKETWAIVGTLPTETVGGLLFKHIFEQADVSSLFPFGRKPGFNPNPDAVAANPDVMKHGATVVKTVTTAIGLLTDLPSLVPVLKDLGAKHAKYGVVAAHYPVVGAAFLKTLQVGLGKLYTVEVREAFTSMWGVVEATMLAGVVEAEAAAKEAAAIMSKATPPQPLPPRPAATPMMMSKPANSTASTPSPPSIGVCVSSDTATGGGGMEEDDDSELVEKLKSALLTKLIPVCRALDITSTRELREYGYDELASDMRTHANYTLLPNTWRKIQALVAMESLNSTPLPFTGTPSPIKSSPGVVTGTPVEESIKVLLMNDQRVPDLDALLKTGTAMPVVSPPPPFTAPVVAKTPIKSIMKSPAPDDSWYRRDTLGDSTPEMRASRTPRRAHYSPVAEPPLSKKECEVCPIESFLRPIVPAKAPRTRSRTGTSTGAKDAGKQPLLRSEDQPPSEVLAEAKRWSQELERRKIANTPVPRPLAAAPAAANKSNPATRHIVWSAFAQNPATPESVKKPSVRPWEWSPSTNGTAPPTRSPRRSSQELVSKEVRCPTCTLRFTPKHGRVRCPRCGDEGPKLVSVPSPPAPVTDDKNGSKKVDFNLPVVVKPPSALSTFLNGMFLGGVLIGSTALAFVGGIALGNSPRVHEYAEVFATYVRTGPMMMLKRLPGSLYRVSGSRVSGGRWVE